MTAPLRDALARAIYDADLATVGDLPVKWDDAHLSDTYRCLADAVLDLLVEHREQVLTHLGMTVVGRFGPGGFDGDGWLDGVEVYVKDKSRDR